MTNRAFQQRAGRDISVTRELLINSDYSCDQYSTQQKRKGSPTSIEKKHNQTRDDVKGEFMDYQPVARKTPLTIH